MTRLLFVVVLVVVLACPALAQPGGGGDPGHGEPVPLTGLELLIGAGGALGARHYWIAARKKKG